MAFLMSRVSRQPNNIKPKTYQWANEHSCMVTGHLAQWDWISSLAMDVVSGMMIQHCLGGEEGFLVWSQRHGQKGSPDWINGYVLMAMVNLQVGGHPAVVWTGEGWAAASLLSQDTLNVNGYLSIKICGRNGSGAQLYSDLWNTANHWTDDDDNHDVFVLFSWVCCTKQLLKRAYNHVNWLIYMVSAKLFLSTSIFRGPWSLIFVKGSWSPILFKLLLIAITYDGSLANSYDRSSLSRPNFLNENLTSVRFYYAC